MPPSRSWLLGAMVAPTPPNVGVAAFVDHGQGWRLPAHQDSLPASASTCLVFLVMTVGIATFLFCAGSHHCSNAKRVLAYSTISNLGLIVACAGVGSDGAIWAAIFLLLIFHAVAKSLLFLCVSTA